MVSMTGRKTFAFFVWQTVVMTDSLSSVCVFLMVIGTRGSLLVFI
jgi:hypothetical protein